MSSKQTFTAQPPEEKNNECVGKYPEIIVTGTADKPYYEIKYYDTNRKEWYLGYSSYELRNVFKWLESYFGQTTARPSEYGERLPENDLKPGDGIYWLLDDDQVPGGWYVSDAEIVTDCGSLGIYLTCNRDGSMCDCPDFVPWSELGKSFFATYKEAEVALAEKKEEKN